MPSYDERNGKVRVRIQVNGRQYLKNFNNKADARL